MPLVSVIIPAYNGVARYLEQAIDSVLAQTFQDFELIVVDDASTDDTARLVLRFARARYCRRPENGGQAAARNDGARLAQGAYLAFLDQDDLWDPSFLEATLALLQASPEAALVHCDGYQVNERNDPLHYDAAMKHGATITQLLRGGHDVATSGSLFRRTCFDAVSGYDETLAVWEDIDLAIRLYQRFPILHLPKPLYRHRLYAGNVSRDIPSERALQARRRFLEKYASIYSSGTAEADALRSDWSRYYADLGKSNLAAGRTQDARNALWLSLRHQPFNGKTLLRLLRSYLVRGRISQSIF
jgi:glycosyltransferase involved in cell wall biosynthesis